MGRLVNKISHSKRQTERGVMHEAALTAPILFMFFLGTFGLVKVMNDMTELMQSYTMGNLGAKTASPIAIDNLASTLNSSSDNESIALQLKTDTWGSSTQTLNKVLASYVSKGVQAYAIPSKLKSWESSIKLEGGTTTGNMVTDTKLVKSYNFFGILFSISAVAPYKAADVAKSYKKEEILKQSPTEAFAPVGTSKYGLLGDDSGGDSEEK